MKLAVLLLMGLLSTTTNGQVRVWLDKLTIPVYEEGSPDVNPPFDAFATGSRFNYPYTLRTSLTGRRITEDLRAVYLENEYLKCSVLPDIGGHVYSCTDKLSGREMFYANPSLKKQLIGYRGAWAAFGIEFNFPVSHNWMSMSPVDFAFRQNADSSASVFVSNIDRPYGMEWRVELVLRPGSTVLEEKVTLYNRDDFRRRYYWWNNAAAEVGDDSRICYPMRYTASHGFTYVDTWPVNHEGRDLSIIRNHTTGPVSEFVHGSREPFMGVWHPRSNTGVVHYANYADLPGKKVWSWGVDADGLDWRRALSDNNSGYIEIQAGLFRNQETYAFLPPQSSIQFSEYWMPVRAIGGISRANLHGVVAMRREGAKLIAGLNVNHAIPDAQVRVLDGQRVLLDVREPLDPAKTFTREIDAAPSGRKCTFELRDARGQLLLAHTEDTYDWTPESEIHAGPQPAVPAGGPLDIGEEQELNGNLPGAMETYRLALEHSPGDFGLNRAAGRLAVTMKDYQAGVTHLLRAQQYASNDAEIHYYLGHAYNERGDGRHARTEWEGAERQPQFRPVARFELAQLDAREGRRDEALAGLRAALLERPEMTRVAAAEVALLRAAGRDTEALLRLTQALTADPSNSFLRYERVQLGAADETLWRHLGSDPERVLVLASGYMQLGLYQDAVNVLAREYPPHAPAEAEPGTVLPQQHPMVAYYRGYCRAKLGQACDRDFQAAAKMSTRYAFPYRPESIPVLKQALLGSPRDATAHFLLGEVYMSAGMTDAAIAEWRSARDINPRIPVLDRNLGRTLLALKRDDQAAIGIFREGLSADPLNTEIYSGLTQALSIMERPAAERVAVLEKYPDRAHMPTSLALDLALSYAETGQFEQAEAMFHDRHFEKEEGGANVRQVYLEIQLQHALDESRHGRRLTNGFGKPVAGLEFTQDGMEPFLAEPRFEYYRGVIEKRLGAENAAQEHWRKAAAGHGVFALRAQRELGQAGWKEAAAKLAGAADSDPTVERGIALAMLGRTEQAHQALRDSLRATGGSLSHYFARRELAE